MTTENNQTMIQVTPEQIVFIYDNPRFKGMGVTSNDPSPYGKDIDEMYDSMIHTYKNTGSLVLNPPTVEMQEDGKVAVKAGFKRTLTFVSRYMDLKKELGVNELALPVYVLEGVTLSESLMENLMRSDQHYMATAHTVYELRESGRKVKDIAHQMGLKNKEVTLLNKLAQLDETVQRFCYTNIEQAAAEVLTNYDAKIQQAVIMKFLEDIENEILEKDHVFATAENMERYIDRCVLVDIPEYVYREAFEFNGEVFPMITEEPWYIGDLFDNKCTNETEMLHRNEMYWQMITESLETVEEYSSKYFSNYKEVPMGTHPEEVAVWSWNNSYISFRLHRDKIAQIAKPKETVKEKTETIDEKAERKKFLLLEKKRTAQMQEEIMALMGDPELESDILTYVAIEKCVERMNEKQYDMFCCMAGIHNLNKWQYNFKVRVPELSPMRLLNLAILSMLHEDFSVHSEQKALFKEQDIDWEQICEDIRKDSKEDLDKIDNRAKERKNGMIDSLSDAEEFFMSMFTTYMVRPPYCNMYDALMEEEPEEKLMNYVSHSKRLGLKLSGKGQLRTMRLRSAIKALKESFGFIDIIDETTEEYQDISQKLNSIVQVNLINASETTGTITSQLIQECTDSMNRYISEIVPTNYIEPKINKNVIFKAAIESKEAAGEELVRCFLIHLIANKVTTLNIKGFDIEKKVSILG